MLLYEIVLGHLRMMRMSPTDIPFIGDLPCSVRRGRALCAMHV